MDDRGTLLLSERKDGHLMAQRRLYLRQQMSLEEPHGLYHLSYEYHDSPLNMYIHLISNRLSAPRILPSPGFVV